MPTPAHRTPRRRQVMTLTSRKDDATTAGGHRGTLRDPTGRRGRSLRGLVGTLCLLGTSCLAPSGKTGVPGELDTVLFAAQSELVFTERLVTGGALSLRLAARRSADDEAILRASLRSSDDSIAAVQQVQLQPAAEGDHMELHAEVALLGAGEAKLAVRADDAVLDQISVRVVAPAQLGLLDGSLLASDVDARLPLAFALADGTTTPIALEVIDRCGGAALDLGAVQIALDEAGAAEPNADPTPTDEVAVASPLEVQVETPSTPMTLAAALPADDPLTPRSRRLLLSHPALSEPVHYDVKVVPPSAVDEVDVEVVTANPSEASLWARAYSDDVEVIGLTYSWDSSPRVTLDRREGTLVSATVSFPEAGAPADERPALVGAEVYGTAGERDLLALTSTADLVATRLPPREQAAPTGPSCGGTASACDPYGAALLMIGFRSRRRWLHTATAGGRR